MLEEFEARLREFLGVKHALCVANATLGLMMVADALKLKGKVILPAFTFVASAQALSWSGLEPVFCDIDRDTQQIDLAKAEALITDDVSAIMGVNLWGGACRPRELSALAEANGVKAFFDSAHAFGCQVDNMPIGGFGDAEVFSFHATKVLSTTEGGCITTNDDELARRLRSIRPSYGGDAPVSIVRVANARMSEVQAAVGIMNLDDFPDHQAHNASLFGTYSRCLEGVPGIKMCPPAGVSYSNYQYGACTIDEAAFGLSRDTVIKLLLAENVIARRYFYPGIHRSVPYGDIRPDYVAALPETEKACATSLQLPVGAMLDKDGAERISAHIRMIQANAGTIRSSLGN